MTAPLTTVDMNLRDLGCMAAKPLLVMVEGAQDSGIVRLPCSLIIRESGGSRASCPKPDEHRRRPRRGWQTFAHGPTFCWKPRINVKVEAPRRLYRD